MPSFVAMVLIGPRIMKDGWGTKLVLVCVLVLATLHQQGEFRVSIPVGVNYLFDISPQLSFIETGLGVTWAEESIWKTGFQNSSSEYEAGFFASIGYRHQAPYGLMWRIDYTPFFTKYRIGYLFLGLSAGWSF